jgi:hypothetical protein
MPVIVKPVIIISIKAPVLSNSSVRINGPRNSLYYRVGTWLVREILFFVKNVV